MIEIVFIFLKKSRDTCCSSSSGKGVDTGLSVASPVRAEGSRKEVCFRKELSRLRWGNWAISPAFVS